MGVNKLEKADVISRGSLGKYRLDVKNYIKSILKFSVPFYSN